MPPALGVLSLYIHGTPRSTSHVEVSQHMHGPSVPVRAQRKEVTGRLGGSLLSGGHLQLAFSTPGWTSGAPDSQPAVSWQLPRDLGRLLLPAPHVGAPSTPKPAASPSHRHSGEEGTDTGGQSDLRSAGSQHTGPGLRARTGWR